MNNNENNGRSSEKLSETLAVSEELSDDMEMVSPGVMLREAREKSGLTQEDIAQRLNFKVSLVESIEQDNLDPKLPATFNRGYLSSYAKVVAVEIEDVLASHDALGAAQTQRSELQSFSNLTIKEAEHSRVMWLSYLIIAILVGLTVLWWMQEEDQQTASSESTSALTEETENAIQNSTSVQKLSDKAELRRPVTIQNTNKPNTSVLSSTEAKNVTSDKVNSVSAVPLPEVKQDTLLSETDTSQVNTSDNTADIQQNKVTEPEDNVQPVDNDSANAVFTFSGDCWVNIYDATGERVAWGVKKSGYVMTVKGKAPLRVTLGKPELATISYNEQPVDMSSFNVGNIAKFTLPLSANEER